MQSRRMTPAAALAVGMVVCAAPGCGPGAGKGGGTGAAAGAESGGQAGAESGRETGVESGGFGQTRSGLGAEQASAGVYVLESAHWGTSLGEGASSESFRVELSVRNDDHRKQVGILWTSDGWRTTHDDHAIYVGVLPDGREHWRVQIEGFSTFAPWLPPFDVEYAAYAVMNGARSWSPYRNHYVYHPVTVAAPVVLLESSVHAAAGLVTLQGTIRALNVPVSRRVSAVYSLDRGATWTVVPATSAGPDFAFSTPLPVDPASTEQVQLRARLETEGETHDDDNGGRAYVHVLAPQATAAAIDGELAYASGGVKRFSTIVTSDLPIDQVWLRLDGGTRTALPQAASGGPTLAGFTTSGSVSWYFSTESLSDGPHTIAFDVSVGPFLRSFPPVTYHVANRVRALGSWDVRSALRDGSPWSFRRLADGRYVVAGEHTVGVFAAAGDTHPSSTFEPSGLGPYQRELTVDGAGRVYVLTSAGIVRWTVDGRVDRTFGQNGVLGVDQLGGQSLCYASDLEATAHFLYVLDSCNARALRLTLDGVFVAALPLGVDGTFTVVTETYATPDALWIGRHIDANGGTTQQLLRLSDDPASAFRILGTVPLDAEVGAPAAFAVAPQGGFWVTSDSADLHRLDATGRRIASWTGGDLSAPLLIGALGIANQIQPLPDGSVDVLSVDTGRIEHLELIQR